MALINCPECTREISDKAKSCPHCGLPIEENPHIQLEKQLGKKLVYPELPLGYSIGKELPFWIGGSNFIGEYKKEDNFIKSFKTGENIVQAHQQGISIGNFNNHFNHIIKLEYLSGEELIRTDKSVIGRAIVGSLIGPVTAIIGGLSALDKTKLKKTHFLTMTFWEKDSKSPQTLMIRGKKNDIQEFINTTNQQISKMEGTPILMEARKSNRKKQINVPTTKIVLFLLAIILGLSALSKIKSSEKLSESATKTSQVEKPTKKVKSASKPITSEPTKKLSDKNHLGSWRYKFQSIKGNIEIHLVDKKEQEYEARLTFDGESAVTKEQLWKSDSKYIVSNNRFGEYYKINNDGTLGVYDKSGLLTICKKN